MPELKHQHNQENEADLFRHAQDRSVKAEKLQQRQQDFSHLHEKLESWCQQLENRQNRQEHQLKDDHAFYYQEWQKETQQQQVQPEEKARYQLEKDTIERFENFQQEQLKQLKQLEDLVVQQQQRAIQSLEERQSKEIVRCLNDPMQRQQLEAVQQQERNDLEARLQEQRNTLDKHWDNLQFQIERDRGNLQEALYKEQPLGEILDIQESVHCEQTDKLMQQLSDLQQRLEEARNLLSKELNGLQLPDEAIKRILVEAGSGLNKEQQATDESKQEAIGKAKGQIFEELLKLEKEADSTRRNFHEVDQTLEFIAGDRIRDMSNRKLTDGILVLRDSDNKTLYLIEAYEAKAGLPGAKELYRKAEELTKDDMKELEKYAHDLAIDEIFGVDGDSTKVNQNAELQAARRRNVSEEKSQIIKEITEKFVVELRRYRVQAEMGGQVQKTIERLSPDSNGLARIQVDGREFELAMDKGRNRAKITKVLPEDVRERDKEALRLKEQLKVTKEQLKKAANSLFH